MPIGQVDMVLTIPGEAPPTEAIVGQVDMLLTIPAEVEAIVGQVDMVLTIPAVPPDEEPPTEWEDWIRENWEVIAAIMVAVIIVGIILVVRK